MSQHAEREAAARAFDANPCPATAEALSVAVYGTEDWWTPDGTTTRNGFRCVALWVAHVRVLDAALARAAGGDR
jgi:UDP-glucose 4-epimerase